MSKISLTPQKQLIDINESFINFEAVIEVISLNNEPFEGLVVSQKQLDTNSNLEFKSSDKGQFAVEIFENNGVFDNWYLVLRSKTNAEVQVNISKKELPPLPPPEPVIDTSIRQQPVNMQQLASPIVDQLPETPKKSSWKFWVILAIVVIGGFVLWYMYKRKPVVGKGVPISTEPLLIAPEVIEIPQVDVSLPVPQPVIEAAPSVDIDLLQKINNILL